MEFIMGTKDIVIGCITNYNWDNIKTWVNSLEQSGFTGEKIMICYDISYELAGELSTKGFTVFGFKKNDEAGRLEYAKNGFNICVERFGHIAYFLSKLSNKEQYRYVISTDVKDVVFQSNPSEWLEKNLTDKELCVGSESLRYKDEPWGKQNMYLSYGPIIYEDMQDNTIYNAGTISGKFQSFIDFCQNIALACGGSPAHVPGGGGPDQAAMNILLNLKAYKDITLFTRPSSGYAAQLGTTADPRRIEKDREFLLDAEPKFIDGKVCTSEGKPFTIAHQYDRIPEWKKIIEEKYA